MKPSELRTSPRVNPAAGQDDAPRRELTEEEHERIRVINEQVRELYALLRDSGTFTTEMPVGAVQWIHVDKVRANDYNPNSVAPQEMRLLYTSIAQDGYTQPVVAIRDETADDERYVLVDGFHRYTTMRRYRDIYDRTGGYLPVVVLDKPLADRIASTVRHNRARGAHSIAGMGQIVFQMLREGVSDAEILRQLGMEPQELARLKHTTGYSALYDGVRYTLAQLADTQVRHRADYMREHPDEIVPLI